MKTTLKTHELQVGDIWNGKRIVRIDVPHQKPHEWNYFIFFSNGDVSNSAAQSQWEIERKIEYVER